MFIPCIIYIVFASHGGLEMISGHLHILVLNFDDLSVNWSACIHDTLAYSVEHNKSFQTFCLKKVESEGVENTQLLNKHWWRWEKWFFLLNSSYTQKMAKLIICLCLFSLTKILLPALICCWFQCKKVEVNPVFI